MRQRPGTVPWRGWLCGMVAVMLWPGWPLLHGQAIAAKTSAAKTAAAKTGDAVTSMAKTGAAETGAAVSKALATPVAEADAPCAHCHSAIYQTYLQTPTARASGLATENLVPGSWVQPATGVRYEVTGEGGKAVLRWSDPKAELSEAAQSVANTGGSGRPETLPPPGRRGQRTLEYFLGSGHLGVTYLYAQDGYLLESPVAYYAATRGYDMKPGLADLHEVAPAIPMEPACLRCHMSGVQPAEPGSLNHWTGLPFAHGGITCEGCHGVTDEHVRTGGRAAVVNPAKLTAVRRDSVCMSCHLEGDESVERQGRTVLEYRPGDELSTYLSFFVYGSARATARGVSEVEQFATSHCKQASGDAMSCTSCHDPHFSPAASEKVAFYRGKCLSCHTTGTFAATHHPEQQDCTSCHMPKSAAGNIPHVAWTDHRILASPATGAENQATDYGKLVAIFAGSGGASDRDTGLAYFQAAMAGHREAAGQAYTLLKASYAKEAGDGTFAKDVPVLIALGTLENLHGDAGAAQQLFTTALTIDPKNATAATNLAVLLARAGQLGQGLVLMQPVFDRNHDVVPVASNLAAMECIAGDAAGARKTLETALRFSPGSQALQQRLATVESCGAPK